MPKKYRSIVHSTSGKMQGTSKLVQGGHRQPSNFAGEDRQIRFHTEQTTLYKKPTSEHMELLSVLGLDCLTLKTDCRWVFYRRELSSVAYPGSLGLIGRE